MLKKIEEQKVFMTGDSVIFTVNFQTSNLEVLLIERGNEPFKGKLALPGGFLNPNETLKKCAERELFEETRIECSSLKELGVVDSPNRDPRGRVIAVAFYGIIVKYEPLAKDDTAWCAWLPVSDMLKKDLAFDHKEILNKALIALKNDSDILNNFGYLLSKEKVFKIKQIIDNTF